MPRCRSFPGNSPPPRRRTRLDRDESGGEQWERERAKPNGALVCVCVCVRVCSARKQIKQRMRIFTRIRTIGDNTCHSVRARACVFYRVKTVKKKKTKQKGFRTEYRRRNRAEIAFGNSVWRRAFSSSSRFDMNSKPRFKQPPRIVQSRSGTRRSNDKRFKHTPVSVRTLRIFFATIPFGSRGTRAVVG